MIEQSPNLLSVFADGPSAPLPQKTEAKTSNILNLLEGLDMSDTSTSSGASQRRQVRLNVVTANWARVSP